MWTKSCAEPFTQQMQHLGTYCSLEEKLWPTWKWKWSCVRLFVTQWIVAHGIFQARVLEWVAISFSNLDSILKSRDIPLPTKVHPVKAMFFPIIMYGYENWAIKKAEHQRIDAFELWCWRRLLRVPWTVRRSNQSILKETIPGCSLEGLMLKLKFHYFGYLMRRTDSLEKTLMLGKIKGRGEGDDRGLDGWMESLTWWTWVWASYRSWWWTGKPVMLQSVGSQRIGHNWETEVNWTEQRNLL